MTEAIAPDIEPDFTVDVERGSFYDGCLNLGKFSSHHYLITTLALGCLAMLAERRSGIESAPFIESLPVTTFPSKSRRKSNTLLPICPSFDQTSSSETSLPRPTCTPNEQQKIGEVVNILNNYGVSIVGQMSRLDKLKEEISQVHPLVFLETIFSNEDLKNKIRNVFENPWKPLHQKGFLDGLAEGLGSPRRLDPYLDDWAKALGTTKETVRQLIIDQNWRGLVDHLLQIDSKNTF